MIPNETDNQEQGGPPATTEALEQPQSMPLGVGNFEEQVAIDPLSGDGGQRKRIDSGSLLIIIVIVVAVIYSPRVFRLSRDASPTSTGVMRPHVIRLSRTSWQNDTHSWALRQKAICRRSRWTGTTTRPLSVGWRCEMARRRQAAGNERWRYITTAWPGCWLWPRTAWSDRR